MKHVTVLHLDTLYDNSGTKICEQQMKEMGKGALCKEGLNPTIYIRVVVVISGN